jgi:uncharacterized membrane protein YoaK (UPF0700 family)
MYGFISGAIMLASFVAALFFFTFWRRTLDRLFAWLALSFFLLGSERIILAVSHANETSSPDVYLVRLVAFLLIIVAIVDKNRHAY